MPPDDVELLRLDEAGYLLGRISARSVRRLIDQGKLSRVNVTVGGSIRVTRAEVLRYIAANTVTDRPAASKVIESPAEATARREAARVKVKATWNDGSDPFETGPRKRPGKGA